MVNWIIDNKEWLFSGAGLLLLSWAVRLLKKPAKEIQQRQKGGMFSTNVQIGVIKNKDRGRDT